MIENNLPPLSRIARELPPSGIRRFFDIASKMHDVISLGVGEPDFATPWVVREAAIYSLEKAQTSYTSNYGLLELRQEISKYLKDRYGVKYAPEEEILITVGVSEGMDLAMRVLLDPGDEVLVPEPSYVSYKPCVSLAGGIPVSIKTTAANGFRPTIAQINEKITPRTKAIVLGYPSNPTGATLDRAAMIELVESACKHNLYIISDEIYDRLTYEGLHACASAIPGARERTVLLNGFSKSYAMTGWRIGYACAPVQILAAMMRIHSYTALCASTVGQRAALEAMRSAEPSVVDMVEQYKQRRNLIVDGLNQMGLPCHMPNGAFYAFPSIKPTGLTSEQFAEMLLFEEKVAVVPGTAFGEGGDGFIRCSYATGLDKIELAIHRMEKFVSRLQLSTISA